MSKFKEFTKEKIYFKKNWSHYVWGLESREPTKEATYIYYKTFINYYFLLPKRILINKIIIQHLSAEPEKALW
jgi:hypothetical protein